MQAGNRQVGRDKGPKNTGYPPKYLTSPNARQHNGRGALTHEEGPMFYVVCRAGDAVPWRPLGHTVQRLVPRGGTDLLTLD